MPHPPRPIAPLWLWGPLVVWMGLIFLGSSTPAEDIPGFLSFLPHSDKVLHLTEYLVLGLLASRLAGRWAWGRRAGVVILAGAAFALAHGVTDEIHQIFVEGRVFSLADLAMDVVGGAVGAVVWIGGLRRPWRPRWW